MARSHIDSLRPERDGEDDYHAYGEELEIYAADYQKALAKADPRIVDAACLLLLQGRGLALDRASNEYRQVGLAVMLERQKEGIAAARIAGRYAGRKPTAMAKSADIIALVKAGMTKEAVATKLGIGVASVYRALRAAA